MEQAGSTRLVVTYPDEIVSEAASKMLRYDIGRLPVVDRADHRKAVGYLGRSGVMAARLRRFQDEHVREAGMVHILSRRIHRHHSLGTTAEQRPPPQDYHREVTFRE